MPDAIAASRTLLEVRDLEAWYGESHVLHGMSFNVAEGEVATLLGRNGAGKTTTLKAVMGILPERKGDVAFDGHSLIALPSYRIARLGVAYCAEDRGILASLSVEGNRVWPPPPPPCGTTARWT